MRPRLGAMRRRPCLGTMQPMENTTEARLDVLQAAVLALAATLPPQRAQLARRLFCASIADLED